MEQSQSEKDDFLQKIPVSHETMEKLEAYAALLAEWNQKFNLIAKSTLEHIWQRHFLDSAQLAQFVPDRAETIADMGSGAGFPGMVLAIMDPTKTVHLIESTTKKANFLQTVSDQLKLSVKIDNCRVESSADKFDVITARAMAPLKELFKLSNRLIKKDSICLFLKGQNADMELTESKKSWRFDIEKKPSLSDASGNVLIIKNLSFKYAATHKRR